MGGLCRFDLNRDIESRVHSHSVQRPEKSTEVRVVQGAMGKYRLTDRGTATRNTLDDFPNPNGTCGRDDLARRRSGLERYLVAASWIAAASSS